MVLSGHFVIQAIQHGCEGVTEYRALPSRAQVFAATHDARALASFVRKHRDTQSLYFGVATRRDSSSGRTENCHQLGALFADLDFATGAEPAARAQLAAFPVPPSVVIHSGGGLHTYWLLDVPIEVGRVNAADVKALLRRLSVAVGGDLACAEVARVLRIPNTLNHKHTPPVPVAIEVFDPARRYGLSMVVDHLPLEPAAPVPLLTVRADWKPSAATADRYERGRAYLRAMGPAIQGSGGDAHTFRATCWLVNDLALSESDALMLLTDWNSRCSPPWTERELQEKVEHARRYGHHPVGAALIEIRNRIVTVKVRVTR